MLFTKDADFALVKVPSLDILQCDKAMGLTTFIGCDAHPATAEIRPTATRSIPAHLMEVAHGIAAIDKYLAKPQFNKIKLMALPFVDDEALGGHIHISFFVDEPNTRIAMDRANQVYHVGNLRTYNKAFPSVPSDLTDDECRAVADYTEAAKMGEAFTPEVVCKVLNHLVLPFENWVQPWQEREKRVFWCDHGNHYNNDANYLIRWVNGTRPAALFPRFAYLHVEYRQPSTWLQHPALAYVYFALVKLVMANFDKVRDATAATKPLAIESSPANQVFKEVFHERLTRLTEQGLRWPGDTKALMKMVALCGDSREEWYSNRNKGVCYSAWKELLG